MRRCLDSTSFPICISLYPAICRCIIYRVLFLAFFHHLSYLHTPPCCFMYLSPADFNLCHVRARRERHLCIAVLLLLIFALLLPLLLSYISLIATFIWPYISLHLFTISAHRSVLTVDVGRVAHLLWQHENMLDFSVILYLVIILRAGKSSQPAHNILIIPRLLVCRLEMKRCGL